MGVCCVLCVKPVLEERGIKMAVGRKAQENETEQLERNNKEWVKK